MNGNTVNRTGATIGQIIVLLIVVVILMGLSTTSFATLTVVGEGTIVGGNGTSYQLIYDSCQDITWLDYSYGHSAVATYQGTTWQDSMSWAEGLTVSYNGQAFSGWRLPTTVDGMANYPTNFSYDGTTSYGYHNTASEMGHLYYIELGNLGYFDTNGNYNMDWYSQVGYSPFENWSYSAYWSGTEYSADPSRAWLFYLDGGQDVTRKSDFNLAHAVHAGNITVQTPNPVPIPSTLLLLAPGLAGLLALRKKRFHGLPPRGEGKPDCSSHQRYPSTLGSGYLGLYSFCIVTIRNIRTEMGNG